MLVFVFIRISLDRISSCVIFCSIEFTITTEGKKMRTKNIYQFRGWEGTDVDTATSLFEDGFLYNPRAKKDQCNIIYGVTVDKNGDYTSFDYSSVDWKDLLTWSWIEWDKVYSFSGTTEENYKEFSVHALSDLVSFYGSAEIFGENYYEGFKVNGH